MIEKWVIKEGQEDIKCEVSSFQADGIWRWPNDPFGAARAASRNGHTRFDEVTRTFRCVMPMV